MVIPWEAIKVIGATGLVALVFELGMYFLFYKNSPYTKQLETLDRMGKRMEAAQAELTADPNNAAKKKALQRLEKELNGFAISIQGAKFKIAFLTGASMLGGMWMINKGFGGTPVAKMPFVPFRLFTNLTHLGLPGDDMTDVSAAFFFATTSPLFRTNLQKLLGSSPSRTATKYLNGHMPALKTEKTS